MPETIGQVVQHRRTGISIFSAGHFRRAAGLAVFLAVAGAASGGLAAAAGDFRADEPAVEVASKSPKVGAAAFELGEPYIRIVDSAPGEAKLQIASKSFAKPGGGGPVVHLTGAIHIADADFYSRLQAMLDKMDVVLFEGVRPKGGSRLAADASDEQREVATRDRVAMVAGILKAWWETTGTMPESLAAIGESKPKLRALLDDLATDGWGKPVALEVVTAGADGESAGGAAAAAGRSIRVYSHGKDGAAGGNALDSDIEQIVAAPKAGAGGGKNKNLQERLAKAFGLSYQGEAMDSSKPNWRSSDLSIDQIIKRAKENGADASILLSMLDGNSVMAKIGAFVLGFIESSPSLRSTMKITLVEVLANADPEAGGAALGKGGAALMKVIIEDRNEVVLDDLARIISDEPAIKSVSAFYGAGHMADMERKLTARLGFVPAEVEWVDAVVLNAAAMGLPEKEFVKLRKAAASQAKAMTRKAK